VAKRYNIRNSELSQQAKIILHPPSNGGCKLHLINTHNIKISGSQTDQNTKQNTDYRKEITTESRNSKNCLRFVLLWIN